MVAIKIFNYKELSHELLGYENGADGCVRVQMFTIESVTSIFQGKKWYRCNCGVMGHVGIFLVIKMYDF